MKRIEAEIRGEIKKRDIARVTRALGRLGFKHVSTTRRTSVMCFGRVSNVRRDGKRTREADARCRVTNGHAEIVMKIGDVHAPNRIEIAQEVTKEQMIVFATMFAAAGLEAKVGSKLTKNYRRGNVTVSIVQSPSGITYVEMEIISNRKKEKSDLVRLHLLAKQLGIFPIKSRKAFLELCERLTKQDDWLFKGTQKDLRKLKKEIKETGAG